MHKVIAALDAVSELGDCLKNISQCDDIEKLALFRNILAIGKDLTYLLNHRMESEFDCSPDCQLTIEERRLSRIPANRIEVIKRIRQRTGLGLKEAKDMADDYMVSVGIMYRDEKGNPKWSEARIPS